MKPHQKQKYINNLCKPEGSRFYLYRFMVNGQLFTGSTSQEYLKDAKKELERLRKKANSKAKGTLYTPKFSELLEDWAKEKKASNFSDKYIKNSIHTNKKHVISVIGDKFVDLITSDDIATIKIQYLSANNAHGCNSMLRNLKCLLKFAEDRHNIQIPKIPMVASQDKPIIYMTLDKVCKFLDEIDFKDRSVKLNPGVSFAVRMMIYCGLRESEVLHMKWANLDRNANTYLLDETKGGESVYIDVPPEIFPFLDKLSVHGEFILSRPDGQPRHEGYTKKAIRNASLRIGMKFSSHTCRRTHACLLASIGVSAFHIKEALRHEDIATSQRYVKAFRKDVGKAQQTLWEGIRAEAHRAGDPR